MKIFISMPFSGYTKEEINERFSFLCKQVKGMFGDDTEIPDTYIKDCPAVVNHGMYKFAKGIEILSSCDAIIFADGWRDAPGCVLEYQIAKHYGLKVIE